MKQKKLKRNIAISVFNKNLGKHIIKLRTKKNWTQSELARACKKDRQAIRKVEHGMVNPTLYSIYELAVALEVTLSEILNFKDE